MHRAIEFGLQPALLVGALALWSWWPTQTALGVGLLLVQVILITLEVLHPARADWSLQVRERGILVALFLVLSSASVGVQGFYNDALAAPLAELRTAWNLDIWPHHWPALIQAFMVFFASEFIWYWIHRAEHRWPLLWRVSGHGAHHAFKKLGALNSGLNHPLEYTLIVLPTVFVALLFDVGIAATGAAMLALTQASIAHVNLRLNSAGIGWLLTTNRYHIHHHSVVLEESNTNYACSAIVWDRLFGTFADAETVETGTGPTEPDMWAKFLMPVVEPSDTATAPSS